MSLSRSTSPRSRHLATLRRSGPTASRSSSMHRWSSEALDWARRHSATQLSSGSHSSTTTRVGAARALAAVPARGSGTVDAARSAARSRAAPLSKRTVEMPALRSFRARSESGERPSQERASRGRAHRAPKTRRSTCMSATKAGIKGSSYADL
eukprot:scaffold194284_cov27-Tisochrysis_lutea.AAC.2